MEQVILAFQQTIELWAFVSILLIATALEPLFTKGQ